MNYIIENKAAWEEAFNVHQQGWKVDPADKLLAPNFSFLDEPVLAELQQIPLAGKVAGQFCCNNGRELLSLVKLGARAGIGFDLAENFIQEGRRLAQKTGLDAQFIATDIAAIPAEFNASCDLLFISAGALCWFQDLEKFFDKVAQVLAPQGILLIHEIHPFTQMIAMEREPDFDKNHPDKLVYSYFKTEPWIDNSGVDYVGHTSYRSKTFYSFSHTFADIINAIAQHGMVIEKMQEFDIDISAGFEQVNHRHLPLSYLLKAKKA